MSRARQKLIFLDRIIGLIKWLRALNNIAYCSDAEMVRSTQGFPLFKFFSINA
jgi:hypothetical protein